MRNLVILLIDTHPASILTMYTENDHFDRPASTVSHHSAEAELNFVTHLDSQPLSANSDRSGCTTRDTLPIISQTTVLMVINP
jgi:hypothetical protein